MAQHGREQVRAFILRVDLADIDARTGPVYFSVNSGAASADVPDLQSRSLLGKIKGDIEGAFSRVTSAVVHEATKVATAVKSEASSASVRELGLSCL